MAFTNIFSSSSQGGGGSSSSNNSAGTGDSSSGTSKQTQSADSQLETPSTTPPSSTGPSGTATPRPDPSDRRFPSILTNYFTQVRDSFQSAPPQAPPQPIMSPTSPITPTLESDVDKTLAALGLHSSARPDADALASPPSQSRRLSHSTDLDDSSSLGTAQVDGPAPRSMSQQAPHAYPTPPLSSASSMTMSGRARGSRSAATSGEQSPTGNQSPRRPGSAMDILPTSLRRATFSSPSMSVANLTAAHASHISNPGAVVSHAKLSAPVVSRHPVSPPSPSQSTFSLAESSSLTGNAASPRKQTPPRSPRSQSRDSKTSSGPASRPSHDDGSRRGSTDGLARELRGKLSVSISAGRGLRPSVDPYLVCQFQYNEYISKGPRSDDHATGERRDDLRRSLPMQRIPSDTGKPMAIHMKSRQSSQTSTSSRDVSKGRQVTDPLWNHDAVFDVVGTHNGLDVSVYDHSGSEAFLGHVRLTPSLSESEETFDQWLKLEPRGQADDQQVSGEIHLRLKFQRLEKKHIGPEDFQILKLIGKGTFGQVFQVRKKDTQRIYAMKVLSKKVIVQKKEVAHTVGERNILVRTAMTDSPFIVALKFSFQTPTDLYLVTDYMSGGELFWHLQKESRFQEARAKFYIAELILALQHLHEHDIVYRDLKPENILLDANGHIALCDFGLSKANLTKDDTTNTFCGTTEYLAPEVLLDESGYTKMVDFWSLGVLVFEMVCGWSPFYAEDTQQMYKNIAFGKVRFPRDALSTDGRNFVKGLLNRNPRHRLGANGDAEELKAHPFFSDVDWMALCRKEIVPPFKPKLKSETDTSNFDPEFTNALNGASSLNARAAAFAAGGNPATTPLSPTMQANFKGFTFVDESTMEQQFSGSDHAMDDGDDDDQGDVTMDDEPKTPAQRVTTNSTLGGQSVTGQGQEEAMFGAADM